jgi:ABC-type transporter Mla MlaB component
MLRITLLRNADEVVVKLEGTLTAPWIAEVEIAWLEARTSAGGRNARVDVRGLCHVDRAGRALMARMFDAGATFITSGCEMPEIVREISGAVDRRELLERV